MTTNLDALYWTFFLGNGGDAGQINLQYRKLNGQVQLRSCRGTGAEPATNGKGGKGINAEHYLPF